LTSLLTEPIDTSIDDKELFNWKKGGLLTFSTRIEKFNTGELEFPGIKEKLMKPLIPGFRE
jgi:hypothetical protein